MLNNIWPNDTLVSILAIIGLIVLVYLFVFAVMFICGVISDKIRGRWGIRRLYRETFNMEEYFLARLKDQDQGTEELKATYKTWIEDSFHDYRTRI